MNKIGAEIMAKFDRLISEFGNTAEILQAASKDLAAENAAAAAEDYGRTHRETLAREAELRDQIVRLIHEGHMMVRFVSDITSRPWYLESDRARELIK